MSWFRRNKREPLPRRFPVTAESVEYALKALEAARSTAQTSTVRKILDEAIDENRRKLEELRA